MSKIEYSHLFTRNGDQINSLLDVPESAKILLVSTSSLFRGVTLEPKEKDLDEEEKFDFKETFMNLANKSMDLAQTPKKNSKSSPKLKSSFYLNRHIGL